MTYLELLRAVVSLPADERTRFVEEAKRIVDRIDRYGNRDVVLPAGVHPKWAPFIGSVDDETAKGYEEAMRMTSQVDGN